MLQKLGLSLGECSIEATCTGNEHLLMQVVMTHDDDDDDVDDGNDRNISGLTVMMKDDDDDGGGGSDGVGEDVRMMTMLVVGGNLQLCFPDQC